MHREYVETPDMYSWETFKTLEWWKHYFHLCMMIGSLVAFAFFALFMMGGTFTKGMAYFIGIMSAGTGIGATTFLLLTNHPNHWVRKGTFIGLFILTFGIFFLN